MRRGGSVAPDDLPRGTDGRIPQWVIDEAAGRAPAPTEWREWEPAGRPRGRLAVRRRRRVRTGTVTAVAVVALVLGVPVWLNAGAPGLPAPWQPVVGSFLEPAPTQVPLGPYEDPSADVVALADEAHMSERGRELFYRARPEILDAAEFAGRCDDTAGLLPAARLASGAEAAGVPHAATAGEGAPGDVRAVGCYTPGSIVVFAPSDPRLRPATVRTAAHEMLHAAWDSLGRDEQAELTTLLERQVAAIDPADPIRDQIASSVGDHTAHRPTELFAYVGTQVWQDGGLAPRLEEVYARFVTDRAALVAGSAATDHLLDQMRADVEASARALADQRGTTAQQRARYEAQAEAVASYREQHDAYAIQVAEMPQEQRLSTWMSMTWWDGTELPSAPIEETLAAAGRLLERDTAALAELQAALAAAEAAAEAEQQRVDAAVLDLQTLAGQLVPD